MHRTFTLTLLAALLLVPAPALAGDSLLSGYGGPGGGEQVVLGSKLLPTGGGKGGGLRSRGATPPAVARSVTLPSSGPAAGLQRLGARPAHTGGSKASGGSARADGTRTVVPGPALTARPIIARSGDAGSPLGGGELLLGALGALALALTAFGTRRLVSGSGQGLQT